MYFTTAAVGYLSLSLSSSSANSANRSYRPEKKKRGGGGGGGERSDVSGGSIGRVEESTGNRLAARSSAAE